MKKVNHSYRTRLQSGVNYSISKTDPTWIHTTLTNENIQKHEMHSEEIVITKQNILKIYEAYNITAVGTTSLRVLESIYYLGSIIDKQKKEFQLEYQQKIELGQLKLPQKKMLKKMRLFHLVMFFQL